MIFISARAPPVLRQTVKRVYKNKKIKEGKGQQLFCNVHYLPVFVWVFTPFSPEMYKTFERRGCLT